MLKGEEIKALNLVNGFQDSRARATSYDLSVGQIITSDGTTHLSHILKRQGLVKVISQERIELPDDVFGTVLVKTSMSDRGLLALNIGLIDPSYRGKIASYIINFSDDDQPINQGDAFLRATFQRIDGASKYDKKIDISNEEYWSKSQLAMVNGFSDKFLNYEEILKDFVRDHMESYKTTILKYVTAAGLALSFMVLLLNFGNVIFAQRWLDPQATIAAQAESRIDQSHEEISKENRKLLDRIDELEKKLGAIDEVKRAKQ